MGDEGYSNKIDYQGALNPLNDYFDNLIFLVSEQRELLEYPAATEEDRKESREVLRGLNRDFFESVQLEIYLAKKIRTKH